MFATTLSRNLAAAAGAVLISTACLAVAATPAAAETVAVSKTVSYADLNLGSAKGRATLDQRIKSAARQVCRQDADDLSTRAFQTECVKTAVAKANAS